MGKTTPIKVLLLGVGRGGREIILSVSSRLVLPTGYAINSVTKMLATQVALAAHSSANASRGSNFSGCTPFFINIDQNGRIFGD